MYRFFACPHVRVLISTPYQLMFVSGVSSFVRMLQSGLPAHHVAAIVVQPPEGPDPRGTANLILTLRSMIRLMAVRRGIDVVHCQQLHLQSLGVGLLGRVLGKRVVLTVHGRSPPPAGLRGAVFRAMEKACERVPDQLVFVASSLQVALSAGGIVIPNGVPVEEVRARLPMRNAVRRELGISTSLVLLFMGRVTRNKGVSTLLDAFDAIRQTGMDLRLLLVGPIDHDVSLLLESRPEHGRFVLAVGEQTEPWRFLVAGDIFVLPSMSEGLPLSLLEAMAAGIPAVASAVGDVATLLQDRKNGLIVAPGDSSALSAAILELVGDPSLATELAREGFDTVQKQYSRDQMITRYLRVYRG